MHLCEKVDKKEQGYISDLIYPNDFSVGNQLTLAEGTNGLKKVNRDRNEGSCVVLKTALQY